MRIAYIHQYFVTRSMAGGTRSYEQARRLVEHGHEVHVVTTRTHGSGSPLTWQLTVEDGIQVHWLPVPYSNSMSFGRRILAFLRFAVLASIKAVRLGGDVVFATSTPLTVAVPGILASRLRRARFVFEVRDLWPELPVEVGALRNPVAVRLAFWLARTAYRNADQVVALSQGMADGVAAYGYPADRISVVPNASDLDLFATADAEGARLRLADPWLGERPVVAYVGTFGLINGVGYLVRLAAAMTEVDPEVRFLLVGDGAELARVGALADELGVREQNLRVLPPVAKDRVPAILGAADVAVSVFLPLPGMAANSANKFFDALAAGRPVAINYHGWQEEVLRESGAGVVLDADDPVAAAKELADRLRDRDWLRSASRAAHHLAVTRYSRDLLFDEFLAAVVGPGPRRRRGSGPGRARGSGPGRVRGR
jgi:glycosyltransferase involved in cell wall biosynthesis